MEEPQSDEDLNSNTWKAAKVRHSGAAVEEALRRQKTLTPDLWVVAFLMAQGYNRINISHIVRLKQRRVDMLIAELRSIVTVSFALTLMPLSPAGSSASQSRAANQLFL